MHDGIIDSFVIVHNDISERRHILKPLQVVRTDRLPPQGQQKYDWLVLETLVRVRDVNGGFDENAQEDNRVPACRTFSRMSGACLSSSLD